MVAREPAEGSSPGTGSEPTGSGPTPDEPAVTRVFGPGGRRSGPPSPGNPPLPDTGQREVPPPPPPRPAGARPGAPAASEPEDPSPLPRDPEAAGSAALPAGEAAGAADPAGAPVGGRAPRRDARRDARRDTARRPVGMRPTTDLRPLRYRLLPRTAIGISIAVLSFALGASLAGVGLYAYYEYRLTQNEDKVSALTSGIPAAVKNATNALKAQEADAQNLINQQIAPLKSVLATGQTVQQLIVKVAPAVYFVHTLDNAGQPAVGTAFAVASDSQQTLLLTSYTAVQAATRKPGPPLYVRHGNADQAVTVYTWDQSKDLALIILPQGSLPTLTFAPSAPQVGERVFAVSGLGAAGAAVTQGFIADVSADGIQHDASTGPQYQGGPLLNSNGQVVGILSRTFSPLGFSVADVWFAVPPSGACAKVLQCPGGTPAQSSGSGAAG